YRWSVKQDGLEGEVWLSTYDLRGFVLIRSELRSANGQPVILNVLRPCSIEIERPDLSACRFFINSGNQNYSGSVSLDNPRACRMLAGSGPAEGRASPVTPLGCSTVCAFR